MHDFNPVDSLLHVVDREVGLLALETITIDSSFCSISIRVDSTPFQNLAFSTCFHGMIHFLGHLKSKGIETSATWL